MSDGSQLLSIGAELRGARGLAVADSQSAVAVAVACR
jgi:hypothetical protein